MDKGKIEAQARNLANDEDENDNMFFVPKIARWETIKEPLREEWARGRNDTLTQNI